MALARLVRAAARLRVLVARPGTDVSAPDPKPRRRIRNSDAIKAKLAKEPVCRVSKARATEGHHVLLRSQGGDDVEDNIVPLSLQAHRDYHDARISIPLRADEVIYVTDRLGYEQGIDYLRRRRYELP